MTERFSNYPESNPFSTRFTAPGKTPFFFERSFLHRMKARSPGKFEDFFVRALGAEEDIRGSVCVQFLIDEFESRSRRGQIVGPHGTGKSTLTAVLKTALTKRGYEVFSWTLRDQRSFLPDVFWLELQQFLQQAPAFLPTKCLLPPPVFSRQEYWSANLDAEPIAASDEDETFDDVKIVDEFQVGETSVETGGDASAKSANPSDVAPEFSTSPATDAPFQRKKGFLGFNAAGNFGFNATRGGVSSEPTSAANFAESSEPVEAAPFPGVAPPNEPIAESRPESRPFAPKPTADAFDETAVRAQEPQTSFDAAASAAPGEQKKLAIPLPVDYDFEKNRRLFEKKVVCFDGFEQLSYVNRIVLRTFCRMNRLGLLLTTHTPAIGIPVLFRTSPSVEILRQILNYLLDDYDMTPSDADLDYLIKSFNGDVREILFSLYDAFESYRWSPRETRQKIVRRRPR